MKLFVPGRVCLFGEHTDWAAYYRRINADIDMGYALIAGTNQGIYADVKPHPSNFTLTTTTPDGTKIGPFVIPMEREALLEASKKEDFFSYAAGVVYQVLIHYHVRGLEINNYCTDLPIKKGLSSSAAICVLIARAFNRVYDLKMTIRGEMEYAYLGEITTSSRCGRMDQGCAYGNQPILMIYDGDHMDVKKISIKDDLHFVLVDLQGKKDTVKILNKLNKCYPFPDNEIQENVQKYFGKISPEISLNAVQAIQQGDREKIGQLMKAAQDDFDTYVIPCCPSELTAPLLHKVLNYKPIQEYIYGGKGVGSQGDGSAQFIAKNADSQQKIVEIIQNDLKMPCLKLTLSKNNKIKKAIIPAAGFGTRVFPSSKAIKKEFFPIIDKSGMVKPAILVIVEEAMKVGIEEICIIVQKDEANQFEDFFCKFPEIQNFSKLSIENQKYSDYLMNIGHKITFVIQDTQDGFGHAVYCAKDWVGDEPFLLMLGDHLFESNQEISCAGQIINIFNQTGKSVVGLQKTPGQMIHTFGCVTGLWNEDKSILSITQFTEKPDVHYAKEYLQVEGLEDDYYLTLFGQYILKPEIFQYLEENIENNLREKGEFQLTSCLERLRQEDGFYGIIVDGQRYDIGNPEAYRRTVSEFGRKKEI